MAPWGSLACGAGAPLPGGVLAVGSGCSSQRLGPSHQCTFWMGGAHREPEGGLHLPECQALLRLACAPQPRSPGRGLQRGPHLGPFLGFLVVRGVCPRGRAGLPACS